MRAHSCEQVDFTGVEPGAEMLAEIVQTARAVEDMRDPRAVPSRHRVQRGRRQPGE